MGMVGNDEKPSLRNAFHRLILKHYLGHEERSGEDARNLHEVIEEIVLDRWLVRPFLRAQNFLPVR